jgi:hypothetical protein
MRKALGFVLLAPLLTGLRCGTDSGSDRPAGYYSPMYSGAADAECEGERKQDLAMCTFKKQTGCSDVTHTLDGEYKGRDWWRVEGCGQHLDCWYSNETQTQMRCTWPHDLDDAKDRLALESGCSADGLQATAQQRIYKCGDAGPGCKWRDRVLVSVGWRIAGCEQEFSCSAAYDSSDYEDPVETSTLRGVDCKAALVAPAVAPAPLPAPVAQICGPTNCAGGCCGSDGRCKTDSRRDDQCGWGGMTCVNCARDEGERNRCSSSYTCVK